jgi:hypothetical protein
MARATRSSTLPPRRPEVRSRGLVGLEGLEGILELGLLLIGEELADLLGGLLPRLLQEGGEVLAGVPAAAAAAVLEEGPHLLADGVADFVDLRHLLVAERELALELVGGRQPGPAAEAAGAVPVAVSVARRVSLAPIAAARAAALVQPLLLLLREDRVHVVDLLLDDLADLGDLLVGETKLFLVALDPGFHGIVLLGERAPGGEDQRSDRNPCLHVPLRTIDRTVRARKYRGTA